MARATRAAARSVELAVGALGEPRDRAAHAAGALVGGEAQAPAVAVAARARAARSTAAAARRARPRRRRPARRRARARRAGPRGRRAARSPGAARRGLHRADEHVVGRRAGATAPGTRRSGRRSRRGRATTTSARPPGRARARTSAATNAARSSSSRQAVNGLLELVDGEHERVRGQRVEASATVLAPSSTRSSPHRMLAGPDAARAASARCRAARRPRARAAARRAATDDLPLPDGPTTPSSGAPTSRATSSATSRSRPKKYVGVGASNDARPLNGQIPAAAGRVAPREDPRARAPAAGRRRCRPARPRPRAARCGRRPRDGAPSTRRLLASSTVTASAARASSRQVE